MFKYIGGAVVYGFAFYGLGKFLERQRVKVVYLPASGKGTDETIVGKSVNARGTSSASQVDERDGVSGKAEQSQEGSLAAKSAASSEH